MIRLEINTTQFQQQLDIVAYQQLPFATALALTRTAEEAVVQGKLDLSRDFIIRRNWVAKGFRVGRATKAKPIATIAHKDAFMVLQLTGGEKHAEKAPNLAIPQGARPTPQAITTPAKWPGHLKRRFYIKRGGRVEEFVRVGRKGRKGKHRAHAAPRGAGTHDPNVRLMYILKPSVHIRPRWRIAQTVAHVAAERWPVNFKGFLEFALRTAK